jgi:hypothetical protein
MSSESAKRFESLQREFNAYVDHIMKEGKQTAKSKSKAKQEQVVVAPAAEAAVAPEPAAPKKRGRKPKIEELVVVAPVAC